MAVDDAFIGSDASVVLNAVDLSDHVRSVRFRVSAPKKRRTAMGDTNERYLSGLPDYEFVIEWNQDHDLAEVDQTLEPLVGGAPFSYAIKPLSGAVGADNPARSGNCLLTDYDPVNQDVGEVAVSSTTFAVDTYAFATA